MKTLILDDGWQSDGIHQGYSFCGDWQISSRRFPDMAAHVRRVQEMGIRYMVWFSVPFVGTKSANYARFKGKYLYECLGAGVLDPRFPECRAFLVGTYEKALRDWNIDGFLLNPRVVFTQATSSHAEARSPRFVRGRLRRASRLSFESCAFFGAFSTRVFGLRIGFQMANQ